MARTNTTIPKYDQLFTMLGGSLEDSVIARFRGMKLNPNFGVKMPNEIAIHPLKFYGQGVVWPLENITILTDQQAKPFLETERKFIETEASLRSYAKK